MQCQSRLIRHFTDDNDNYNYGAKNNRWLYVRLYGCHSEAKVIMPIPLRNIVFEKVKDGVNLTDQDLSKQLSKQGVTVSDAMFNKILLDLEINGLIKVGWITKDTRRIEIVEQSQEEDSVERQNREQLERDYEASFPGHSENNNDNNNTSYNSSTTSSSRSTRPSRRRSRGSKELSSSDGSGSAAEETVDNGNADSINEISN